MRGSSSVTRGNPGTWEYRLELGTQPAQCLSQRSPCHRRQERLAGTSACIGSRAAGLQACPICGGELVEVSERRERTVGGFRLQSEAQAALDKAKVAVQQGDYVEPCETEACAATLIHMWLPSIVRHREPSPPCAPTRCTSRTTSCPRIGGVRLQRLSPDAIGAHGDATCSNSLAPGTVHLTHVVLASRSEGCRKAWASRPQPGRRWSARRRRHRGQVTQSCETWNAEQVGAFLAATHDDRLGVVWRLLAMTGHAARRGTRLAVGRRRPRGRPALGAPVSDVGQLRRARLASRRRTKGRRMLPLDVSDTVAALREARPPARPTTSRQWGKAWTDSGYVFTRRERRSRLQPDGVSKHFDRAVRAAMLPRIRLHDLTAHLGDPRPARRSPPKGGAGAPRSLERSASRWTPTRTPSRRCRKRLSELVAALVAGDVLAAVAK